MAAEKEKPGARAPHSTCSNLQIKYTTNWGKVKGKVKPMGQKNQGSRIEQAEGAANFHSKGLSGVFDRVRMVPYTGWIRGFHSSSLEDLCIKH